MWAVVGAREGTRYPLAFRDSDERADVALWQLPQSATCRLSVIIGTAPVQVLDRFLILGFPGKEGLTVAQVSVENTTSSLGLYKVDGFLRPGFSGGPALNEAGQVVALVQGGTLPGTENNDLVPIAPAIDLINRRGVRASINEPAPYADHCYSSCREETHGVEGWGVEEPWRNETGWIDGGSGQDDQCALLKAATLAGRPGAEIQVTRKWEESRKDLLGHVTYKYFCEGILRANPVYFEKRSSACGLWN
jgi:hypothetical protein